MKSSRNIQMTTNFEGLINLLSDGLYSTSDIFVRELIQNGHDSIIRRQAAMNDSSFQGGISVDFDQVAGTITFSDNGIGMDEEDIEQFLSVIGSTGTGLHRQDLEQKFSDELIGQFGIGILSSFLVAKKVDVLTRKLGSEKAFLWSNLRTSECTLFYDVTRPEVGSTITVYLREEYSFLLDRSKLVEIIIRYCDFITVPIRINSGAPVNAIYAPWDKQYDTVEQMIDSYEEFVNRRFPDMSMDVFPVEIDTETEDRQRVRARGVLYISNQHLAGLNSVGMIDIFVRKMLVKEGDTNLLPVWAKFVRGVIDSPNLRPTMGRDNVNQEDPAFKAIQDALGDVIVDRLSYLAEYRPDKFAYINQWHHDHLKGMAMVNDEFFNKVADLLLFETNYEKNEGLLSLRQYLPKNTPLKDGKVPVYYFAYYDSAAQYYRMAADKGLTIINAGQRYDEELLEKYGKAHPEVVLEKLDVLDKGVFFEELQEGERKAYRPIEYVLSDHLNARRRNLIVSTKRFTPVEIPAVIIETNVDKTDRELANLLSTPRMRENFGDIFSSIRRRISERPIQLALNANSQLIQLLAKNGEEIYRKEFEEILIALYNNALLYSHRLDEKNRSLVHDSVTMLMVRLVELMDEKAALNEKLEQERAAFSSIRRKQESAAREGNRPDHIRLFMIAPFNNEYNAVEKAVRKVFELKPFWFEVQLARNYGDAGILIKNIQTHIESSHCFIAEISELSPNVMIETGGLLMSGDERPLFAIRSRDGQCPPVELSNLLTFTYESRVENVDAIAQDIRNQIFTEGRLSVKALIDLCELRDREKMKHFLSRSLLENLLEYINLGENNIEKICKKYTSIEQFSEADKDALRALGTDIPIRLLEVAQDKLREEMEGRHGR